MVMTLTTCRDRCREARSCARHSCNRPDPRVRDQHYQKFDPDARRECWGFIELDVDSATTH